ncbi:S8 family serine peptidase [Acidobacteriota bacterium]
METSGSLYKTFRFFFKPTLYFLCSLAFLMLLVSPHFAIALESTFVTIGNYQNVEVAKGEFLVRFVPELMPDLRPLVLFSLGLEEAVYYSDANYSKITMTDVNITNHDMEDRYLDLTYNPYVEHVEYNLVMKSAAEPLIPVDESGALPLDPQMVDLSPPSPPDEGTLVIAMLGTGIAYRYHQEGDKTYLQAPNLAHVSFVEGYDFINGDALALDDDGRGTFEAGVLVEAIESYQDMANLDFDYAIMPVKVLDEDGEGTVDSLTGGIRYQAVSKSIIIQIDGIYPSHAPASNFMEESILNAYDDGCVIIGAAGNDGMAVVSRPSANDLILSVGAANFLGERADYSNYGDALDFLAIGGAFTDADQDGFPDAMIQLSFDEGDTSIKYFLGLGTSLAAAQVSALSTCLIAGGVDNTHIKNVIATACDHPAGSGVWDAAYGYGLINPQNALAELLD